MSKLNPDLMVLTVLAVLVTMWLFVTPLLSFFLSLSVIALITITLLAGLGLLYGVVKLLLSVALSWDTWQTSRLNVQQQQLQLTSAYLKVKQEEVKLQLLALKIDQEQLKLKYMVKHDLKPGHRLVIGGTEGLQLIDGTLPTNSLPNVIKTPSPDDALGYSVGEQWIKDFLFHADGGLKIHHVSINGPTRSGKTWLLLHLMSLMQQPHPEAEYYLIDPKWEGAASGWPFDPMVTDFDDVPQAVSYIYEKVVKVRRLAKQQDKPIPHPAFVCIDEFDGCSAEHKDNFLKPVSRGVKEGASGGTHYMAVGQSTLIGDIGGSGALYRNMARIIMGTESLAFIKTLNLCIGV